MSGRCRCARRDDGAWCRCRTLSEEPQGCGQSGRACRVRRPGGRRRVESQQIVPLLDLAGGRKALGERTAGEGAGDGAGGALAVRRRGHRWAKERGLADVPLLTS